MPTSEEHVGFVEIGKQLDSMISTSIVESGELQLIPLRLQATYFR
jgi:hypothetical protein